MARKRRTKGSSKRSNRKKHSDSDQNSNGMSDDNEVDSKHESGSEEQNKKEDSNNEELITKEEYQYSSYGEKTHKHPKFRYLERRHSSSQDEDSEYNTCDLMPQQIHDIVLGDMKAVIISQDDIANDTCLQGDIEHEEVIGDSMECDGEVYVPESDNRTESTTAPQTYTVSFVESCDLIKSFEKTVLIDDNVSSVKPKIEIDSTKPSANISVNSEKPDASLDPIVSDIKPLESSSESKDPQEEFPKVEEIKKKTDEPRRRSSRIRSGNRWTDDEAKVPVIQEVLVTLPPPLPTSLFDSDKPVKVKSRWRRTSELEMGGGTSGSSMTSDSEISSMTTLSLTSPDVPIVDADVEEGLKLFEHITTNVFLTPRINKKERLVCECSLTKEEIAKGEMGCGDDCLNRLLMIECGSRCVLGNLCSNKQFQECRYAPCQVIKTKSKGLGLIATVSVPSGTFLMEYVGEVLESKEFRRRAKEYAKEKNAHYYFMQLESSHVIDATLKGNISRFINHSCDPNAETQKWTVNGELRIGFFSKKPISAGEEITFDYKLDRYGKEAQKCYCESVNCRGWIGETPENEKDKDKREGKKDRREKKRKEEKRFLSDREMEDAVEKLVSTGVKNQKHTLNLCRLMVRAEDETSRIQLLATARKADGRCLRLFMDYHGLSLLWSYMVQSNSSPQFRMEVLKTLSALPIFNKSSVQDSKVFDVLQKWAKVENPMSKDRGQDSDGTGDDSKSPPPADTSEKSSLNNKVPSEKDEKAEKELILKAKELLNTWMNLKQEFRIPKKERIEQMKEHERDADRGYSDPRENQSYDRHWNFDKDNRTYEKENRYSNNNNNNNSSSNNNAHRERKRGRESPSEGSISDWRKSRVQQDERHNGSINRLSKTERRQLFAMKVEEEERQRKMEDWAKQHSQIIGPPQQGPPQMDPSQGYYQQPPFHPPPDGGEVVFGGCPPAFPPPFMGPPQQPPPPYMDAPPPPFSNPPPSGPSPAGFHPPYPHPSMPAPPYQQPPIPAYPPFPYNPPPQVYPPAPALPVPSVPTPNLPAPASSLSTPPPSVSIPNGPPPAAPMATVPPTPISITTSVPGVAISLTTHPPPPPPPLPHVFPIKLPPKWRSAKDKEGRIYYYHTKTRKSQWQIPTEENTHPASDSDSDSDESTEEEESSTEEEDEKEEEELEYVGYEEDESAKNDGEEEYVPEELKFDNISPPNPVTSTPPVLKKRREGLVQVNIISPRDEEDDYRCGIKKKEIRETKARLAREKKKLRSGGAAKCEADTSGGPKRRIRDMFRIRMADVVVSVLNPYRKADCKIGRITTTEDFKHLARKLTHFVMVKELKHCASIDDLECNENVKHKARDFVRKYMSKFGPIYKRTPDD